MRKERNKKGTRTRKAWTQIIIEAPKKKDGSVNKNSGKQKKIIHQTIF